MENKEQQLPVQQNDAEQFDQELLQMNIEHAKELFEYEMSEVLLNFKKEAASFKRRDVSEYLDKEIPKADIAFTAPEVELKGIDYSDEQQAVSLPAASAAPITVKKPALTEDTIPSVSVRFTSPTCTVSGPEQSAVVMPPEKLALLAAMPDLSVQAAPIDVPDVQVNTDAFRLEAVPDMSVSIQTDMTAPVIHEDTFTMGDVKEPEISLNVATAEKFEMPVIPAAKEIQTPALSLPADVAVSLTVPALKAEDELKDISVPEAKAFVMPELPAEPTLHLPDAIAPAAESAVWKAPVFSEAAPVHAEIPAVPEKPDFSMYYADIVESLKAAL